MLEVISFFLLDSEQSKKELIHPFFYTFWLLTYKSLVTYGTFYVLWLEVILNFVRHGDHYYDVMNETIRHIYMYPCICMQCGYSLNIFGRTTRSNVSSSPIFRSKIVSSWYFREVIFWFSLIFIKTKEKKPYALYLSLLKY